MSTKKKGTSSKPIQETTVMAEPEDRVRVEAGNTRKPEPDDFFKTSFEKDPDFHYHWASQESRRIHELKRKGYEIDPASSSEEASKKVSSQREYLKRTMYDPDTPKANAEMAKELLDRMESAPTDTVNNIPNHVLMRIPMEKRREIMEKRKEVSKQMEAKIQADVRDLNKALQRSGKGGIQAFKEMFDSLK